MTATAKPKSAAKPKALRAPKLKAAADAGPAVRRFASAPAIAAAAAAAIIRAPAAAGTGSAGAVALPAKAFSQAPPSSAAAAARPSEKTVLRLKEEDLAPRTWSRLTEATRPERRAQLLAQLKAEVALIAAHYRGVKNNARADTWQAILDGALTALEDGKYMLYDFKVSVE